jgi:GTP cyclohydrolase I
MAVDRRAAERAIAAFLTALGHTPDASPDLADTPARVTAAFLDELLSGYAVDVPALLRSECIPLESDGPRGLVVVRDVHVATVCPHHLLPGFGTATVAFVPGQYLVGIGTIARVVDAFARRLTLQEAIGENVVRTLVDVAGARAAHCELVLQHTCLSARGARQPNARVVTVARAGAELELPQLRRATEAS